MNEALGIEALVLSLLTTSAKPEEILVLVGYTLQKRRLQELAKRNGWGNVEVSTGVSIRTIDGIQGNQRCIVIIGCTKTTRSTWVHDVSPPS